MLDGLYSILVALRRCLFPFCFQLTESAHVPWLMVLSSSLTSSKGTLLSPHTASLWPCFALPSFSDFSLLLPPSTCKDWPLWCRWTQPGNPCWLPYVKVRLWATRTPSVTLVSLCTETYAQVLGSRTWTWFGEPLFRLPQWGPSLQSFIPVVCLMHKDLWSKHWLLA